jgi:hypothetical protein
MSPTLRTTTCHAVLSSASLTSTRQACQFKMIRHPVPLNLFDPFGFSKNHQKLLG